VGTTLNLQVNSITYQDNKPSNNPSIRVFDIGYKMLGQPVNRPEAKDFSIAPGETKAIFSGTRTTAISGSTEFDMSQPDLTIPNLYRFTHSGGTAPAFRVDRAPGIDNTSTFSVAVNGPIATYTNTGGTAINTSSMVAGDIVKIVYGSGFNPVNCGNFVLLSKTSTSISVYNLNGAAETAMIADATLFMVYSNGGSSNQIQIKDKVIISAGFSPASYGTYEIYDVTPEYFEILVGAPNGLPIETGIIPGTSGLIFYSSAKRFLMIAAQQKCSAHVNSDTSDNTVIEPVEVNNPERPGLYIKQGTAYALSIKNLSLETLNVIVATAE